MAKIVVINGYPGSGKDTFVEMCGMYAAVKNVLTSDPAKAALRFLGWDGSKTPEARDLLAYLMEKSYELYDGPMKWVEGAVRHTVADVVFVHCREPHNIAKIKSRFSDVTTLFIERDEAYRNTPLTNDSDRDVENYNYDYVIDNNGSLLDLRQAANTFIFDLLDWRKQV